MVERLKHVEDPRVLVEELPGEGGAAARGGEQQDVLPRRLRGCPTVVAQASPPGVLKKGKESHMFLTLMIRCWFISGARIKMNSFTNGFM